jgi:hypothetical protein
MDKITETKALTRQIKTYHKNPPTNTGIKNKVTSE